MWWIGGVFTLKTLFCRFVCVSKENGKNFPRPNAAKPTKIWKMSGREPDTQSYDLCPEPRPATVSQLSCGERVSPALRWGELPALHSG